MDWRPLAFAPILKPKSWGGRRLETVLGKAVPPGKSVGESWEVSDCPGEESVVAEGPLVGKSLRDLVAADAEALVGRALRPVEGGRFPLLAKFIDAQDVLSLQVHPTDEGARRLGGGHRGKAECWYVVAADRGTALYLGLKAGVTRQAFAQALAAEDRAGVEALLGRLEVRPGDFIYVPAGIVHAIGAGLLFAEVSQTSDSTLRLYDWDRRPRRPTHIEAGLQALDLPPDGLGAAGPREPVPLGPHRDRLLEAPAFTAERLRLAKGERPAALHRGLAAVWMTVAGRGELRFPGGSAALAAGRTLLLPAGDVRLEVIAEEDLAVLMVRPAA